MPKLKLHIGLPKTGSSSIQSFLYLNADALAEQGVAFPNLYDGENSHASLVAYGALATGLDITPFIKNFHRLHTEQDIEPFRQRFRKRFESCLAGKAAGTFVMTSELFYTETRHLEQIQALRTFLCEHFSDIEIIAYVRSQEDWISSRMSQTVKLGSVIDLNRLINSRFNNYYGMLEPWWETFGFDKFHLRVLEKEKLKDHDLIADFLHLIEAPDVKNFELPERQNPALSLDAIEFLQSFNTHLPYFLEDKTVNPERTGLTEYMEEYSESNPRHQFPQEQIKIIREKYEPSNVKLAKLFYPQYETLFNYRDRSETDEHEGDKDPTKIAAWLWVQQQQKISAMTDKIDHLETALEARMSAIERENDAHKYKIVNLVDRLSSFENQGFWGRLFNKSGRQ